MKKLEYNRTIIVEVYNSLISNDITLPKELESFMPKEDKYPREILNDLSKDENFISKLKNLQFSQNGSLEIKSEDLNSEISKLLYIMNWKQGDLNKFRGIVDGLTSNKSDNTPKEPYVFYQLGRHIAHGEPLIDQHVLRAFKAFFAYDILKEKDLVLEKPFKLNFEKIQIHKKLKSEETRILIVNYINWLQRICDEEGNLIEIDKIMFALGKFLKSKLSHD
jgi:hypothetical protein